VLPAGADEDVLGRKDPPKEGDRLQHLERRQWGHVFLPGPINGDQEVQGHLVHIKLFQGERQFGALTGLLTHPDDPAAAHPDPDALGGLDGVGPLVVGVRGADLGKVGAAGLQVVVELREARCLELPKLFMAHDPEGGMPLHPPVLDDGPDALDQFLKIFGGGRVAPHRCHHAEGKGALLAGLPGRLHHLLG
jgi:hypothetical protein